MVSYHEHSCDGLGSAVADFVPLKVELFDGGVVLPEIKHKDTVSGGANWDQNVGTSHAAGTE